MATSLSEKDTPRALWRYHRKDAPHLFLIALLPVIVALPQLLGWLRADPMLHLYLGSVTNSLHNAILPGYPYIDPNGGFTNQALGYRAAWDWLHGQVPWWNSYSGVGLPLAAEFQPAAFFPLTLLLLLPKGMVWQHLLLQILAGWGTYGLLRQLGLGRLGATAGALLYAFNGTLAWFDHAPALPVPFLPWMLWGIERARTKTLSGLSGGWRMFAVALAMSLLAGFPETAYIGGLLALAWALLRWFQTESGRRAEYTRRIVLGGVVGIALTAPQILAFLEFLPHAWLGLHNGAFAHAALIPPAIIPSLLAPYAYGPIFAYPNGLLLNIWDNIGGYVSVVVVMMAAYGLLARRGPLGWLLFGWCVLALAKTFGVEPAVALWNMVPGIANVAFFRYAPPSWELALAILAAQGVDELAHADKPRRGPALAAALASIICIGGGLLYGGHLWHRLHENVGLRDWAVISASWAMLTVFVCLGLLLRGSVRWRAKGIATLLAVDCILLFAISTLSNPRGGTIDTTAINFLRKNLGLQRFYTLGPIQPNYGAYFGVASINHNYLPVSWRWVDWIHTHLDGAADPTSFTGNFHPTAGPPSPAQALRRNLSNYEWVGVKYVVAPAGENPFKDTISSQTVNSGNRPLMLRSGQTVAGTEPASLVTRAATIDRVGVLLGNYGNTSTGMLKATVCSGPNCESGVADLGRSLDNEVFYVRLNKLLVLAANTPVHFTFEHSNGKNPVALWVFPAIEKELSQDLIGPAGALPGKDLQVHFRIAYASTKAVKPVYSDKLMTVLELPHPKPYFDVVAGRCLVQAHGRNRATVDCSTKATLVRRELFSRGWTADVNGKDTSITEYKGLFQAIDLPRGKGELSYRYAPPYIGWAWLSALIGLGALVLSVSTSRDGKRSSSEIT